MNHNHSIKFMSRPLALDSLIISNNSLCNESAVFLFVKTNSYILCKNPRHRIIFWTIVFKLNNIYIYVLNKNRFDDIVTADVLGDPGSTIDFMYIPTRWCLKFEWYPSWILAAIAICPNHIARTKVNEIEEPEYTDV